METALDRTYRVYRFFLDNFVGYGAAIIMLASVLLAIFEIIRRYIFGMVFDWGQDAVTYFTVGSIYLYFAVTQARRSHLAVSALMDVCKTKGLQTVVLWVRLFVTTASMTLYTAIFYWGWSTVGRNMMLERTTQSMVLQIWPFQAILIAGFVLLAVTCLFQFYQDLQAVRGKTVFAWAPAEEGLEI
ncbi:MAG: TRAP transporter small permease [Alphaproteobacteria bacterium]|nr:TRAP transporter small permease [Alphaproteobacteria bacterium]